MFCSARPHKIGAHTLTNSRSAETEEFLTGSETRAWWWLYWIDDQSTSVSWITATHFDRLTFNKQIIYNILYIYLILIFFFFDDLKLPIRALFIENFLIYAWLNKSNQTKKASEIDAHTLFVKKKFLLLPNI